MTRTFLFKLILICALFSMILGCTIDEKAVRDGVVEDTIADVGRLNKSTKKDVTAGIATLLDENRAVVGKALFTTEPEGMKIKVTLAAISAEAGEHPLHLHQVGSCYPNFDSAGEPIEASDSSAASDATNESRILPPLVLSQTGSASYEAITDQVTFSSGEMALFDGDGSTIVLHERAADGTMESSGNRLVCGVIEVQLSSLGSTN